MEGRDGGEESFDPIYTLRTVLCRFKSALCRGIGCNKIIYACFPFIATYLSPKAQVITIKTKNSRGGGGYLGDRFAL